MAGRTVDQIISKALKRLDEIKSEAEALDNLISMYRGMQKSTPASAEPDEHQPDLYGKVSAREVHAAEVAQQLEAAKRIILAEKRPMKRGELRERLEAQNFVLRGRDKTKVFGTNLWRSGKFIAVKGQGYWPSDIPPPT
jgi:hypothetical protein